MNELIVKTVFGLLRHSLAPLILWMNANDILTESEILEMIMALAAVVVAVGLSFLNKKRMLVERNTAAAMPRSTVAEVKAAVSSGTGAGATARADAIPIRGTGDGTQ
jgi:hypothetical protein